MENENVMWAIGGFLALTAFVLIAAKLNEFFGRFGRKTQYLEVQLRHAADDEEYSYWRRELHCHYLCLIPFVTDRNAKRVYAVLFRRPRHHRAKTAGDGMWHILAPSLVGVCFCAVCLCGMSWAWFSASSVSVTQTIRTPQYILTAGMAEGETPLVGQPDTADAATTVYDLMGGHTYTLTLSAVGTENATGYAVICFDNEEHYTEQILAVGESAAEFTVTVRPSGSCRVSVTTRWGTCATEITERVANEDELRPVGTPSGGNVDPDPGDEP